MMATSKRSCVQGLLLSPPRVNPDGNKSIKEEGVRVRVRLGFRLGSELELGLGFWG